MSEPTEPETRPGDPIDPQRDDLVLQLQEKLRQAEVNLAEVKDLEERKRRRLTLALASAVLLLVVGASASALWYQHLQAEQDADKARQELRQEQVTAEVNAAVREAEHLLQRGQALLANPDSWQATLESAHSALRRSEVLLHQEPELADGVLAEKVQQVGAQLGEDEKARQLLAAFERVLFKLYEFDRRYTYRDAYQEMRGALAQWGLSPEVPPAKATALVRERPRAIQNRLVAILDFCLAAAPADPKKERHWFQDVLATADPDSWRQQVRQAATQANVALLAKLVDQEDVARQPPFFLVELASDPLLRNHPTRVRLLRQAQQQYPDDFWINFHLAAALYASAFPQGRATPPARKTELPVVNQAIRFYTAALALRPNSSAVYNYLGVALRAAGDLEGAIACYKKALDLDPRRARAFTNLGIALHEKRELDAAIASFHKALELDPKDAMAHYHLGTALQTQGKLAEALACYRKALDLDPNLVAAHYHFGNALAEQKDLAGAIACYHKALALDPKNAEAQGALGRVLFQSARSAVAKAAALKGKDAPKLDKERTHLRQQALDWMHEALTIHTKQLADADAKGREALKQTLQAWQTDTDLASVRDKAALGKFPEAQRAAWQQFWTEVEALRQKVSPSKAP
jgi:tetratricopeptide (TPR) repeat protein